jgi:hypothetical protein
MNRPIGRICLAMFAFVEASMPFAATAGGVGAGVPVPVGSFPCSGSWSIAATPSPGGVVNYLSAVTVVGSDDVWAAGYYSDGGRHRPMIEHWNGQAWGLVALPDLVGAATLSGLAAASASDVWAVGRGAGATLALHWDGTSWMQASAPSPGRGGGFEDVVALTPDDVWAVGSFRRHGIRRALIEHWNGSEWIVVSNPGSMVDGDSNYLNAVSASGSAEAWAAGSSTGDAVAGLAMHWDGHAWSDVTVPKSHHEERLLGVDYVGIANALFVGYDTTNQTKFRVDARVWLGDRIERINAQQPRGPASALLDVASTGGGWAWAAGYREDSRSFVPRTLIERLGTTGWSMVPSPNKGKLLNQLIAVATLPTGESWAVGSFQHPDSTLGTLALHYSC